MMWWRLTSNPSGVVQADKAQCTTRNVAHGNCRLQYIEGMLTRRSLDLLTPGFLNTYNYFHDAKIDRVFEDTVIHCDPW